MEKKKYNIFFSVLKRLDKSGVLKHVILIGSWCSLAYQEYFSSVKYLPSIRTRDIDLLVPIPFKFRNKVDIPKLLEDLGFVIDFKGSKGYVRLNHPELILELLVPERGKGINKPYPLPQLGMNAQALRFLDMLSENTIRITVNSISVAVPHPINFALHKLIVSKRRATKDKELKDKHMAFEILRKLIEHDEKEGIKKIFNSLPNKWRKKIINVLNNEKEYDILEIVQPSGHYLNT